MFSWFRRNKKQPPRPSPGNPGLGPSLQVAWTNGEQSGQEKVSIVECLAQLFADKGVDCQQHPTWLELDSGHILIPQIYTFQPLDDGGFRTCTTVEISHLEKIPPGVFEYQHATGDTFAASVMKGFEGWFDIDWPPLADVCLEKPESCTALEMTFPADESGGTRKRRVLLGPVSGAWVNPRPEGGDEHDSLCPCCLFTRTGDVFQPLLKGDGFHAIRFFAARGVEDEPSADCRVNGLDLPEAMDLLREYVKQWPGEGFETRKQYVIIQSC
jgi:hypothetical protein